jgi:putative flippase GtrA
MNLKDLLNKYRELISYLFWGVATTVVNYLVYFLCTRAFSINHLVANAVAWVAAVVFAFVVNKLLVFESKSWRISTVLPELWKFVSARILSGVMETGLLLVCVDFLHMDDGIVKLAAGVLVVIINYVLSKLFIFRRTPNNE